MVKFGRHLQFYLESDELQQSDGANEDPYIVPYTDIRECIGHSQQHFVAEWTSSLNQASEDYNKRLKLLWKRIFDDLVNASSSMACRRQQQQMPFSSQNQIDTLDDSTKFEKEYRGLPNDRAVQIYVTTIDERQSRELFAYIKKLHSTAAMNGEALRKLVKKFDKGASARGDDLLTATLFPELYSACFMAYQSLETYIEIMRDSLVVSEGEEEEEDILDDDEDNQYDFQQRFQKEGVVVRRRADELSWLHNTISTISCLPFNLLSSLVAHRGFHCPRDGSDKRPMENSLAAYESAWSSGIHLCECDVALTKDEKLVLAHDDDFSRLALDPNSSSSKKKVSDLTMKEIISLTFKSGTRPPLLLDVLRSAQAIGDESKLIIEIKPGNPEACTALVRLFRSHPDLIERCAAVMSFDAWSMHKLRIELDELALTFKTYGSPSPPKAALLRGSPPERVTGSPHNLNAMQLRKSFEVKMPQILLLTVAKEPQMHYELWVDVSDLSPIHSWLRNENSSSLDGVYLQYQSEMLEQNGIMAMRKLSAMYRVGVWGEFGSDPDDCITALKLISECGVSYVNTDLPRGFVSNNAKQYFGLY